MGQAIKTSLLVGVLLVFLSTGSHLRGGISTDEMFLLVQVIRAEGSTAWTDEEIIAAVSEASSLWGQAGIRIRPLHDLILPPDSPRVLTRQTSDGRIPLAIRLRFVSEAAWKSHKWGLHTT
jgi:hypothetical protein